MNKDKKSYRILIIEDNPGDLAIVEDFLAEQIRIPTIVRAGSFKQASAIICENVLPFDVILLDITLPDKSGQDLVAEMLRIAAFSPIIILTGFADIDFSIKSIALGISDYLFKDELNASGLYKSIVYAIYRKKNIAELKESENRYSNLFHASPQPMWVFDPATLRFLQVNKAAIALYGYSEEEFLTMTLMDIRIAEDIPQAKAALCKQNVPNDIFKSTIVHHKKSGELMEMEIYSSPIMIKDKSFRSVIAIDITQKNLYEHNIVKAIIKTQEDERYEIGGELHDNICQILATGQMTVGMLEKTLDPPKKILSGQISKYIKMAIDEIRNISHRLAPAFFDDTTLEEAFGRLLNSFNPQGKYKISLHFNNAARIYKVSLEIQLNLYRILQEELRNIEKYAKAERIDVDVIIYHRKLIMQIADDGIGFDLNIVKKGIGLANIRRRTELFYGKCEINSSPGNGCKIIVTTPIPVQIQRDTQMAKKNQNSQSSQRVMKAH